VQKLYLFFWTIKAQHDSKKYYHQYIQMNWMKLCQN